MRDLVRRLRRRGRRCARRRRSRRARRRPRAPAHAGRGGEQASRVVFENGDSHRLRRLRGELTGSRGTTGGATASMGRFAPADRCFRSALGPPSSATWVAGARRGRKYTEALWPSYRAASTTACERRPRAGRGARAQDSGRRERTSLNRRSPVDSPALASSPTISAAVATSSAPPGGGTEPAGAFAVALKALPRRGFVECRRAPAPARAPPRGGFALRGASPNGASCCLAAGLCARRG